MDYWCSKCRRPWPRRGYCTDCMREYLIEHGYLKVKVCPQCEDSYTSRGGYCSRACRKAATTKPRALQPCGTDGAYQRGCRCGPCRSAHAVMQKASVEKRRPSARNASHKRRALIYSAGVEQFADVEIFERDGWRCHLCKRKVRRIPRRTRDPEGASLDHIVPLIKRGTHTRGNVACAHLKCNLAKNASLGAGVQPLLVG